MTSYYVLLKILRILLFSQQRQTFWNMMIRFSRFCSQWTSFITSMRLELDHLLTAYDEFDCALRCLRNPNCLSVNLASYKDANGKLWCELLSSNSHGNSPEYRENKTSHHLFLLAMVGSVLFSVCLIYDTSILLDYISKIIIHIALVQNSSCCTTY